MSWKQDARCRDSDPDIFFPAEGVSGDAALAVCLTCPVRRACLQANLRERSGVVVGTTPVQRVELRMGRATAGEVWGHNESRVAA